VVRKRGGSIWRNLVGARGVKNLRSIFFSKGNDVLLQEFEALGGKEAWAWKKTF